MLSQTRNPDCPMIWLKRFLWNDIEEEEEKDIVIRNYANWTMKSQNF